MSSVISNGNQTPQSGSINSFTLKRIQSLSNLKIEFKQYDKKNIVTWSANKADAAYYTDERAVLLRREKGSTTWQQRVDYAMNQTAYTGNEQMFTRDDEIDFNKEYDYAVVYYRANGIWAKPAAPYTSTFTGGQVLASGKTKAVHIITLTTDIIENQGVKLKWNSDVSTLYSGSKFDVFRNDSLISSITYNTSLSQYEYTDTEVMQLAGDFKFKIVHVAASTPFAKDFTSNEVIYASRTGIEKTQAAAMRFYPNPITNGTFTVESEKNTQAFIYDVSGHTVQKLHLTEGKNKVTMNSIFKGIYLLRTTEGRQVKFAFQ